MSEPMLTVDNLLKHYAGAERNVFDGISFDVPKGKVLVIIGPSGSGKSTLLRCVAGLEPIQGGTIALNGQVIDRGEPGNEKSGRAKRSSQLRTKIGMVFQSYDLFPNRTVLGNITMAPIMVQKRPKPDVEREAMELLKRVGLADRAQAKPHELSGGQRQRVAICRALIEHPELMLMDEVTAALDPEMVHEVLDVVLELADAGQTMLIVTHEMQFARAIADKIIMIDSGGIVETSDDPDAFFTHPTTQRAQEFLRTFEFSRHRRTERTAPAHRRRDAAGARTSREEQLMTTAVWKTVGKTLAAAAASVLLVLGAAACGPNAGTPSEAGGTATGSSAQGGSAAKARTLDEIKKSGSCAWRCSPTRRRSAMWIRTATTRAMTWCSPNASPRTWA